MPALPDLGFLAAHPGIEILGSKQTAIVGLENQNGILCQILIFQEFHQFTHIPIDIANHS